MRLPLVVLAVLSIVGGLRRTAALRWAASRRSAEFLDTASAGPAGTMRVGSAAQLALLVSALVALAGIGARLRCLYLRQPARRRPSRPRRRRGGAAALLAGRLGLRLALRPRCSCGPFMWLARVNRDDVVDSLYARRRRGQRDGCTALLSRTQTGQLRWYAAGIAVGAVVIVAIVVLR